MICFGITACQNENSNKQPDSAYTSTPQPTLNPIDLDQAVVETLQVTLLESFPIQVTALIMGHLPNSCIQIERLDVELIEDIFEINIITSQIAAGDCIQTRQPFKENISLDVEGLPAGIYWVHAGEHQVSFTLDVDNELPESGGG